jgi:transposase
VDVRRESDIEQLRRIAIAQQVQIEQLLRVLAGKCKELDTLKGNPEELQQTLALLETLTREAQQKSDDSTSGNAEKPSKERKPREKFGSTPQPLLPLEPELFELDEPDRICRSCGGDLQPMKDQFDTSELIDVIEVRYRLIQVNQQKYRCRCGGCIETAPGPERVAPGGRYSLRFGIKIAIDKYLDHLPLARQARILRRHGVRITTQTLWDQLNLLAHRYEAIDQALFAHVLAQPVIGLDQTSWKRLEDKTKKPWQMWCLTAPGAVVHRIRDDKGAATFTELVGTYHGTIVCDALKTHEAGARDGPGITLGGCWAHVFRKFEEAAPDHPEAHLALGWIGELYEIDERAGDDLERRAELRRTESEAVLTKLKTWLWSQAILKSLSIGKAAAYAIANWERLTHFVTDARVPLDNNACERGIRGPVLGRRNHFGSKSRRGTQVAATFYSLMETAKLHDIDPVEYLLEAARSSARGEVLLPWQMRS